MINDISLVKNDVFRKRSKKILIESHPVNDVFSITRRGLFEPLNQSSKYFDLDVELIYSFKDKILRWYSEQG